MQVLCMGKTSFLQEFYIEKKTGIRESDKMSYSIARVAKVKSGVNTTGIQKHVQRENKNYNNKDIDPEKTEQNYDLIHGQEKQNYKELIENRIEEGYTGKRKIRSDAIRHVDGIITSDNEFFNDMDPDQVKQYFQDSLEFLEAEYGKENMLYATVHLDESTPHMHFGFVPLTEDGRLSAKEVVGNKKALTQFQDRYNKFMNKKGYDLERGESKQVTKKKHQDMDKYKQGTKYHEYLAKEMEQKALEKEKRVEELTATLEPKRVKFSHYEKKTDVVQKLIGKSEVIEKDTGNVVLSPDQYKRLNKQIHAAYAVQKEYKRLKDTDLVKENKQLKRDLKHEEMDYERLAGEYMDLYAEKEKLQEQLKESKQEINSLKLEIGAIYSSVKQTLRENTKDFKGFRKVFRDLSNNLKERHALTREKANLEPKMSEFHRREKQEERQKTQELSL